MENTHTSHTQRPERSSVRTCEMWCSCASIRFSQRQNALNGFNAFNLTLAHQDSLNDPPQAANVVRSIIRSGCCSSFCCAQQLVLVICVCSSVQIMEFQCSAMPNNFFFYRFLITHRDGWACEFAADVTREIVCIRHWHSAPREWRKYSWPRRGNEIKKIIFIAFFLQRKPWIRRNLWYHDDDKDADNLLASFFASLNFHFEIFEWPSTHSKNPKQQKSIANQSKWRHTFHVCKTMPR